MIVCLECLYLLWVWSQHHHDDPPISLLLFTRVSNVQLPSPSPLLPALTLATSSTASRIGTQPATLQGHHEETVGEDADCELPFIKLACVLDTNSFAGLPAIKVTTLWGLQRLSVAMVDGSGLVLRLKTKSPSTNPIIFSKSIPVGVSILSWYILFPSDVPADRPTCKPVVCSHPKWGWHKNDDDPDE